MADKSPSSSLNALYIRSGLDHDPHRMDTEILAAIKEHSDHVQAVPVPQILGGPSSAACLSLLKGTMGRTLGRGHTSKVYLSHDDPQYAIKQVLPDHEAEFGKELARICKLPPLSVVNTIYVADGPRTLMPRLWPAPAALQMLHTAQIVHADIHADNVMIRQQPACFVLIDYGGSSGDAVYPLNRRLRSPWLWW